MESEGLVSVWVPEGYVFAARVDSPAQSLSAQKPATGIREQGAASSEQHAAGSKQQSSKHSDFFSVGSGCIVGGVWVCKECVIGSE